MLISLHSPVPCEPGNYFNGSVCLKCANGAYQDQAGQTQCKTCENDALFTTEPRVSTDQCVGKCFIKKDGNGLNYNMVWQLRHLTECHCENCV